MSFRHKRGKSVVLRFKLSLPRKKQRVSKNNARRNYTTVYFGLPPLLVKKLKGYARKGKMSESAVLRLMLDRFLEDMKGKRLRYESLRRTSCDALKVLPRTIRKEQDEKIREISGKTGRSISALVRVAVRQYFHNSLN